MTRLTARLAPAALALFAAPGAAQDLPASPAEIPTPPLAAFHPPAPERRAITTAAGEDAGRLLVIEDHSLPLVRGQLVFEAGSLRVPPALAGLADLHAEALRTGGSAAWSGEAFDAWLDATAVDLEVGTDGDRLRITFSCLSEDLATTLEHLGTLLAEPAFDEGALEVARARLMTAIEREGDDAGALADRAVDQLLYGLRSVYGLRPSLASVAAITAEDVAAFHRAHLGLDRLVVGISGDVAVDAAAALVGEHLGRLPLAGPAPVIPQPAFWLPERTTIFVVDRPGVPQTELRLAGPGARVDAEVHPALTLWSYATGSGGMSHRLARHVRTDLGLAYSVGASALNDWSRPGRWLAWCGTRNEAVGQALDAILETLITTTREALPADELEAARDRLLSSHVFRMDTPDEVLSRALNLEVVGYPDDFYERNLENLRSAAPADVQAAARSIMPSGRFLVVAVGPADEIVPHLEAVADVVVLDDRPPMLDTTAQVDALLAALGGRERWAGLVDFVLEQEVSIATTGSPVRIPVRLSRSLDSGRMRLHQVTASGMTTVLVVTPEEGRVRHTLGIATLPMDRLIDLREGMARSLYALLHGLATGDERLQTTLAEDGDLVFFLDGLPLCQLELGEDGLPARLYRSDRGEETLNEYLEWGEVDGLRYPSSLRDDQGTTEVTSFVPNAGLSEETFEL